MTEPTKQMIVTKSVGQLSEDERERLAEIVEWYECPVCHGEAPQFDMGKFCIACTDRGKLLSPTANIVAAMLNLRWMPPEAADAITALRDRVAALEGALRPFASAANWWDAFDKQQRITTLHQHGDCLEVGHLRNARSILSRAQQGGT